MLSDDNKLKIRRIASPGSREILVARKKGGGKRRRKIKKARTCTKGEERENGVTGYKM
jgi:hypothetical protein